MCKCCCHRNARPLVKVTVKCPCGRKQSHQVVQEGQQPAALPCDAVCVSAGRQQQLAGAFGVEDISHHVSSFDRNRSVVQMPSTGCPVMLSVCELAGSSRCSSVLGRGSLTPYVLHGQEQISVLNHCLTHLQLVRLSQPRCPSQTVDWALAEIQLSSPCH